MLINKAKIVATLGPATSDYETMVALVKAGVSVFRINFSHGSHEEVEKVIKQTRRINDEMETNVALLGDLQGPKLRIGKVKEGEVLEEGAELLFTNEDILGDRQQVYMNYKGFASDVSLGDRVQLDDGKLVLKVTDTNGKDRVKATVIQGGELKSNKGVNLPNTDVSLPCLTKKDLADLEIALKHKLEWIGLSFVRSADDVKELKSLIKQADAPCKVISKIEKPEAVEHIDQIIHESDAIMVARGDLGVEIPMQSVPLIQKMIVQKCHLRSRPVVIATQMMESMIDNLSPTRAEVNDVANSVLDGADAVMLSGETSVGKHPIQVIEAMNKIIAHTEESGQVKVIQENPPRERNERYITDSICYNASKIADQIDASAILTMTFSGYTGFNISSHRPSANILVFTSNRSILNMMSLVWGVRAYFYDGMHSTDQTFSDIKEIVKSKGLVKKGDMVIKIASMPIEQSGMTNMLKITNIG